MHYLWLVIAVVGLDGIKHSSADLKVEGVTCGDKKCAEEQYCSDYDRQCTPCAKICENNDHNYDPLLCERSCQGYIHDRRYVRNSGISNGYEGLSNEVQRWKSLSIATLVLLIILVIIFCVYETCKWKKVNNITISSLRDKFFTKKSDNANKSSQNGTSESIRGRPELRIEIPPSITHSESPTTMTTGISRLPAEDSALDYAYDNPAMASNASSPNVKPHESKGRATHHR